MGPLGPAICYLANGYNVNINGFFKRKNPEQKVITSALVRNTISHFLFVGSAFVGPVQPSLLRKPYRGTFLAREITKLVNGAESSKIEQ